MSGYLKAKLEVKVNIDVDSTWSPKETIERVLKQAKESLNFKLKKMHEIGIYPISEPEVEIIHLGKLKVDPKII